MTWVYTKNQLSEVEGQNDPQEPKGEPKGDGSCGSLISEPQEPSPFGSRG